MNKNRYFRKIILLVVLAVSAALPLLQAAQSPISRASNALPSVTAVTGLNFQLTPSEMVQAYDKAVLDLQTSISAAVSVPVELRTYNNTVLALEEAYAEFQDAIGPLTSMTDVSPNKEVRDQADQLKGLAEKLVVELSTREDIYRALKEYSDQHKPLADVDQKLLDDALRAFRLGGFEKKDGTPTTPQEREHVKQIEERLAELANHFSQNLREYKNGIELAPEKLKSIGLSDAYISSLEKLENGNKFVSLKYPDYVGFMLGANDSQLRQALFLKHDNQTLNPKTQEVENVKILKEALDLRHQLAEALGYETFAHYAIQYNMAKTPERVWGFLNTVDAALKAKAQSLYEDIFKFKKENDPSATELNQWDVNLVSGVLGYWANRYIKERLGYDAQGMNQYFTSESTVKGTMEIYQKLLGVEFREIPVAGTWHEDVKLYEIKDVSTQKVISYFFLDLYPRDGKYGHFAAGELIKGRALKDGSYKKPIAFMMGNFNKPVNGKSANVSIEEVGTFFHEFGHIMHQTLTQARYASQSGSSVDMDFVEAPSQMLENWVDNYDTLKMLSDAGNPLPKQQFDNMMAAKNFTEVLVNIRQVALATLDLTYHTMIPPADTSRVVNEVFKKTGFLPGADTSHFEAAFGHLMGGYQSSYYGYLWSKVIAQDMFTVFERDGMLAPAAGKAYRDTILAHGGSVEAEDLIRWFMGHAPDPQMKAFLKSIGAELPPDPTLVEPVKR